MITPSISSSMPADEPKLAAGTAKLRMISGK